MFYSCILLICENVNHTWYIISKTLEERGLASGCGKNVAKLGFTVFRILLYHTEWGEWTANLGRFSFVRSDQSVLKWNARVLRTGSGQNVPTRGSEPLSSPAPVGQSAGIWRVVAGKNVSACLGPFHLNWPEPVLFGRPERTNRKRP